MKTSVAIASILSAVVSATQAVAETIDPVPSLSTPGKTQVVVFRPKQSARTSMMNYRLFIDGQHLGKLKAGAVYTLDLEPGEHELLANDKDKTAADFVVQPGHTVVYRANVTDNRLRMQLTEVSAEQALAEAPALRDVLDTGSQWAQSASTPEAIGAGGE